MPHSVSIVEKEPTSNVVYRSHAVDKNQTIDLAKSILSKKSVHNSLQNRIKEKQLLFLILKYLQSIG